GEWDVVVVDCAPTAETLRLLALPEALGWYMDRVFPAERDWLDRRRTVLESLTGIRRAGAGTVLTYWAVDAARWLAED
ncbi:MAG: ArsA-related P-loop ATPase, partial [Actinomycetes bacterium]